MKLFCVFFLALISFSFCFAHEGKEKTTSQLTYAHFGADSLKDTQKALSGYKNVLQFLAKSGNDSLTLIAETERLELLYNVGQRNELLGALSEAIALAEKLGDDERLSRLLYIKVVIYKQLGFKNEARKVLNEVAKIVHRIKDLDGKNLNTGYFYLLWNFVINNDEERVAHFINAYRYFMKVGKLDSRYRNAQISGNSSYASAFMERGQLDSATHYLSIAIAHLDPENELPDDYYAIINFSNLQFAKKDYSNAEKWLLYALKQAEKENDILRQGTIYYNLYRSLSMHENQQQANLYLQKYVGFKDSIDRNQLDNISLIERTLNEVNEQRLLKASEKRKYVVFMLIGVSFLLCLTMGVSYIKRRKEIQLPDKDYKSLPELKKREINASEMKELKNLLKQDDPLFMTKFHEYFPDFAAKVNGFATPSLNYSEMEICAYTKLNSSTKDIALHRKCTIRSVENRKYRIRRKLMLAPEIDFPMWIATIQ